MRERQKVLEVFPDTFDHNFFPLPTLHLCQKPNNSTNNSLGNVEIAWNVPPNLDPLPKAASQERCLCVCSPPAKLVHLDSTVEVAGPLECLFKGATP